MNLSEIYLWILGILGFLGLLKPAIDGVRESYKVFKYLRDRFKKNLFFPIESFS
jgi:hypothetical protein